MLKLTALIQPARSTTLSSLDHCSGLLAPRLLSKGNQSKATGLESHQDRPRSALRL